MPEKTSPPRSMENSSPAEMETVPGTVIEAEPGAWPHDQVAESSAMGEPLTVRTDIRRGRLYGEK